MSLDHTPDLIRIEGYARHADAEMARAFLLSRGITGVIATIPSPGLTPANAATRTHGETYELMAPAVDAARAIRAMEYERYLDGLAGAGFADEQFLQ